MNKDVKTKRSAVRSILVSQPAPVSENSPYLTLAKKYNLTIDFRPFIEIEPTSLNEFRKQKVTILDHTAVIFTSRNAVDHFFRLCEESKIEMPLTMKYFCVSEQTANYLQKYIAVRKRKVFIGEKTAEDLIQVLKKYKEEKYIFPCSNVRKDAIPNFLKENGYQYTEAIIYKTVAGDLSDLANINYDIIVFFSPSGVDSLFHNFPAFEQKDTRIAAFGPTTAQAVRDSGLILDIEAPLPNMPSMTGALELYIKGENNV
ncbi:MAG: uroporphyrinogen-III synthase [Cytophagales bacterium]|nr:uroporphyrinogen-III synthase [Cytophagales bacterium]